MPLLWFWLLWLSLIALKTLNKNLLIIHYINITADLVLWKCIITNLSDSPWILQSVYYLIKMLRYVKSGKEVFWWSFVAPKEWWIQQIKVRCICPLCICSNNSCVIVLKTVRLYLSMIEQYSLPLITLQASLLFDTIQLVSNAKNQASNLQPPYPITPHSSAPHLRAHKPLFG